MVHKITHWLQGCPYVTNLTAESLCYGPGTGLFCRGVTAVKQNIMGDSMKRFTYLILHRGQTDENWAERFSIWVLENPLAGFDINVSNGRRREPTRDGFSTWEAELTVTAL